MLPRTMRLAAPLLLALTLAVGCAGAPHPRVSVLGVTRAEIAAEGGPGTMLVEVTNPTDHPMTLAGFSYRFVLREAEVGRGEVPLARGIPAGQTAVIELPMPNGVGEEQIAELVLEGRLRTTEGFAQGGWSVRTRGVR